MTYFMARSNFFRWAFEWKTKSGKNKNEGILAKGYCQLFLKLLFSLSLMTKMASMPMYGKN